MAINYSDFIIHIKKSGQKLKKYNCTCDRCGVDRGYLPKSKAFVVCRPCKTKEPEYRAKLKKTISAIRSSKESKNKTRQQMKQQVANGWKPAIIGMPMTLTRRIAMSCGQRHIPIEDFNGFSHEQPGYKIAQSFRKAIRKCKQSRVNVSTNVFLKEKLGYTFEELRSHLESKFKPWMNWRNHGQGPNTWQIDHVIPLKLKKKNGEYYWSQCELKNPDSFIFKAAWGLSNLQPLLARDNCCKGNRYIG